MKKTVSFFAAASALAVSLLLTACAARPAPARADAPSSLLAATRDPLLVRALYGEQSRLVKGVGSDGAVSINSDFEQGKRTDWFLEQQRYGGDLVQAGVAADNDDLIKKGLQILDWGFAKQGAGGDFPGTGDPFHSTSLFVEAAARGLLLLKESGKTQYADALAKDTPKLHSAALWLYGDDGTEWLVKKQHQYTHKYWIWAAGASEAALLTGDKTLADRANDYAKKGLAKQTSDGINPEKDGYDVSYQALGIGLACRYYVTSTDDATKAQVRDMISKGLGWELKNVDAAGQVSLALSTRTGVENGRSGKRKGVDYVNMLQALTLGAQITGDPKFRAQAVQVAENKHWIPAGTVL